MPMCDWCHETIDDKSAELMLSRDDGDLFRPRVILGGYLKFHRDCGIMALYAALEAVEDMAPGSRPDPAAEKLLRHIPTMDTTFPDGDYLGDQRMRHCLGETKAVYTLSDAGIHTLVDLSFRTRAEVAALRGIGATTLGTLEAAMARRGLAFRDESNRQAVA